MVIHYKIVYCIDAECLCIDYVEYSVGRSINTVKMLNEYGDTRGINIEEIASKNSSDIEIMIELLIPEYAIRLCSNKESEPISFTVGSCIESNIGFSENLIRRVKKFSINVFGNTVELKEYDLIKDVLDYKYKYSSTAGSVCIIWLDTESYMIQNAEIVTENGNVIKLEVE